MKHEQYAQVVLSPDTEGASADPQVQACLRLWAAKLILHLRDYQDSLEWEARPSDRRVPVPSRFREARTWINSLNTHVGSFIWVCELFNINPDYARRKIKKYQK